MKYKALILDVDGTLVGPSYTISPRVKKAIFSVKDKIMVSLCSGRVFDRIHRFVNELELTSLQISDGGGEIYDPVFHQAVYKKIIDKEVAKEIIADIKKNKLHFVVSNDSKYHIDKTYMEESVLKHYHFVTDNPLSDLNLVSQPAFTKITIMGVNKENEKKITKMLRKYSEKVHFVAAAYGLIRLTSFFAIDITEKGATKLTALEEYAKLTGITLADTIVVGDGYNDFPLLLSGGLKVAMGNAVADLKQIADYVAPSVDQDGVAVVIEKFLS